MKITLDITVGNNIIASKIIEMPFCPTIDTRIDDGYIHAKVSLVTYFIKDKELYVNLEPTDTNKSNFETVVDIKRNMELNGWTILSIINKNE